MNSVPRKMFALAALRSPYWQRSWRHRWARRGILLLYVYLGVMLVLLALEKHLVFFPTRDWEPPPYDLNIQDVELTSADGTRIHAWWSAPADRRPDMGAVLYCHGNAGNLSHRAEGIRRWRDHFNLAVLIFDYPGYGRSDGSPSESGCCAAGEAAYDWLTDEKKIPGEGILLYGRSLGGGVAVDLAVRRPHRALVLVSPFASIPDMAQLRFPWLPARWLVRTRFDNLNKISKCRRPVFIAHGTADGIVPFSQGQRLFAAANEPKRFLALDGLDHNDMPTADYEAALRQFLAENAPLPLTPR